MSRLTKKLEEGNIRGKYDENKYATTREVNNKLGELEDIEEELKCPLKIYTKATLGRFWVEDEQKWHSLQDSIIIKTVNGEYAWCVGHDMSDYRLILLSDYQKTWWLKEDRSE